MVEDTNNDRLLLLKILHASDYRSTHYSDIGGVYESDSYSELLHTRQLHSKAYHTLNIILLWDSR